MSDITIQFFMLHKFLMHDVLC